MVTSAAVTYRLVGEGHQAPGQSTARKLMEFREVVRAVRIHWWFPVAGLLIGSLVALTLSLFATPIYSSQVTLFVSTTQTSSAYDILSGSQFSQQRGASYERLLTGEELAERVVDRLGLNSDPADLAAQITASADPQTVLIDVTAADSSPEEAQRIAEAVGAEFSDMVIELETPAGADASPVNVTVVKSADLPTAPSSPQPLRDLALGALGGLVVGIGAAVLRRSFDRSVKEPDEAASLAGAPVVGTILLDGGLDKGHVLESSSLSRTAEDYRQLRTNLQFLRVDDPPRAIMVCSPLPAEGKTTVTINLAIALVDAGLKVVVVEADLRRPRVTRYLKMVSGVGLTNVLAGGATVDEVIQVYGSAGLRILAAGPTPPNPGELLASSNMAGLVEELRGQYDFVLLDAPPLLPVADSIGLAPRLDGVLLSVRYGVTHKDQLRQAALMLSRVHAVTLGVVLNMVPQRAEIATAYGYGYGYAGDGQSQRHRRSTHPRSTRRLAPTHSRS